MSFSPETGRRCGPHGTGLPGVWWSGCRGMIFQGPWHPSLSHRPTPPPQTPPLAWKRHPLASPCPPLQRAPSPTLREASPGSLTATRGSHHVCWASLAPTPMVTQGKSTITLLASTTKESWSAVWLIAALDTGLCSALSPHWLLSHTKCSQHSHKCTTQFFGQGNTVFLKMNK